MRTRHKTKESQKDGKRLTQEKRLTDIHTRHKRRQTHTVKERHRLTVKETRDKVKETRDKVKETETNLKRNR